ncbi:major facilitator superfamily transporter [Apiospora rasikravindrae]|uniref:Major facilitator superfamily transporter n=1 Tax=Apiospora rasikravindrae TaxID=990691 RepID=A0ABR1RTN1_9PEZI
MTKDCKAAQGAYNAARDLPRDYELPSSKNLSAEFPLKHPPPAHPLAHGRLRGVAGALRLRHGCRADAVGLGVANNAIVAITQTLISDLCPGQGASSNAINNLPRQLFNAVGVSFV